MYFSWVEISKSAIVHNVKSFQRLVGPSADLVPIIKSNAYGHDMVQVARLISPLVKWFGVVTLGEALELRRNGFKQKILVLTYNEPQYLKQGIAQGISLPVYTLDDAKRISRTAVGAKKKALVHVKVDTGASRIGVLTKDAAQFIYTIQKLPRVTIEGVYSHFSDSENNPHYTEYQFSNFNTVLNQLKIDIPYIHMSDSGSIFTKPNSYFNLVRFGMSLYGLWPSDEVKKLAARRYPWFSLQEALSWKTKIIQVKSIPKGTRIGYGGTYVTKKPTRMAVIAVGYGEGYDRRLSNQAEVLIRGKRCKILGRVCMNISMVDVTHVKNASVGDEVILIGKAAGSNAKVSPAELAKKIGTISEEVFVRINHQLPRFLVK